MYLPVTIKPVIDLPRSNKVTQQTIDFRHWGHLKTSLNLIGYVASLLYLNRNWPSYTLLESALSHLRDNLRYVAVSWNENSDDNIKQGHV